MKYRGFMRLAVVSMSMIVWFVMLMSAPVLAAGLDWEQLDDRQRSVLQPYQQQWLSLSAGTRQVLARWADLSDAERAQIQARHREWNALSASRQATIVGKLERYKRMPAEKKRKMQKWREWVRSLPSEEQQALHKQWPGLNAEQRKQYIQRLEQKYGKP